MTPLERHPLHEFPEILRISDKPAGNAHGVFSFFLRVASLNTRMRFQGHPEGVPMLSETQVQQFTDQGFALVNGLISADDIEAVCSEISRICESPQDFPAEVIQHEPQVLQGEFKPERLELGVRKLFKIVKHNDFFRGFAARAEWLDVARALLGPDVYVLQSMLMMKPPECSGTKVWHQDNAYFRISPPKVVGLWVACDEATVENGCMHIVPGSHRNGIAPHSGDGDNYGMTDAPNDNEVLAVPLQPGDALIFHGELFHFTPPNQTSQRRRALQYHYAACGCEIGGQTWLDVGSELDFDGS
ncbi:MAG: hypothetical protein CMJ78_19430 [Planctomycetaceae bacterium]|nr:hypothetical protein [Planctomycetaceae bacterium]